MTTLSISYQAVRPKPAGSISSLLRNSVAHPPLSTIDTMPSPDPVYTSTDVTSPKVGLSVNEISIADAKEMRNAKWLYPTIESLAELLRLSEGWNSYGAKRVQPKAIEKALELLVSVLDPDTAPPSVVPTAQGGVQIEWHRSGVDFEIEATASGKLDYFFSGPAGESEGPVEGDPNTLRQFTKYLKLD